MLGEAIAITTEAFRGKKDKGGKPYILHCLRVMMQMPRYDEELMSIAVMHDLVEDTDYSLSDLYRLGFSERVVGGVGFLTHVKGVPYEDYIKVLASNTDARLVKMADLQDNSDLTRLKGVTKKDFDRVEKYQKSFLYLSKT
tara:strand:- start:660 stop:1082 length:423 start_codon:yes stop_codon:yes gene_type:complete